METGSTELWQQLAASFTFATSEDSEEENQGRPHLSCCRVGGQAGSGAVSWLW